MPERRKPRVHVRFAASDGAEWTVWDVTWSNEKCHRRSHADQTATQRVFVNAEGVKRAYKFKPSDLRVFEEQTLERQLKASAFLPTTKEDTDPYSLRSGRAARTADVPGVRLNANLIRGRKSHQSLFMRFCRA
jgi:hypothetical protein